MTSHKRLREWVDVSAIVAPPLVGQVRQLLADYDNCERLIDVQAGIVKDYRDARETQSAPQLLSAGQVAERCSVSLRCVWAWVAAGRLPAVKLGQRCTRFRELDVLRLVEAGDVREMVEGL